MLDGETQGERLKQARKYFEQTIDFYDQWLSEMMADYRFYHGKQWTEEDIAKLRRENRPVLTFNVTQGKILHMLGAHEDNLMDPKIVGRGTGDQFLASALDRIRMQLFDDLEMETIWGECFEDGVVAGIANLAVDAELDPDDPDRVQAVVRVLWPNEVLWDQNSRRRDKRDANFLFWSRWVNRTEFREDFPNFSDEEVDDIFAHGDHSVLTPDPRLVVVDERFDTILDPYNMVRGALYLDRNRRLVRIVHMEYMVPRRRVYMISPTTGRRREIDPESMDSLRERFPEGLEFITTYGRECQWFEFTGTKVLFEGPSPVSPKSFGVLPFVVNSDEFNLPYGKVRNLRDPNRELNKRYSQTLHLLNAQGAPGTIAETDAIPDIEEFRRQMLTPAGVAIVASGALASGRVIQREVARFPEGQARMAELANSLIDVVSGVNSDDVTSPRGIPEAAATTQLKQRKSMMSFRPLLRNFRAFQRRTTERLIDIVRVFMPDDQISDLLSNDQEFIVNNGLLTDETGSVLFPLREMRTYRYDVRMRVADANNTERLLQLQFLMALQQNGSPVAPDVIFDLMALPEDVKIRLKAFAKSAQSNQMGIAQQEAQMAQANLERGIAVDEAKVQAELQKAQWSTMAKMGGDRLQFLADILSIWEKADAGEKEFARSMMELRNGSANGSAQ